jgi:hypothetical protein
MNKDVIYIDVDDDVTAVIGKIKKAKEKIVALVPPKRAGSLQSAVNLRLIDRMARADKKQLVLITNNQALIALAASAKIPVAKNLQTKPEVAEVAALVVDDGDDIIDGSQLPVGDHVKSAKDKGAATVASSMRSDDIDAIDLDIDGESVSGPVAAATVAKSGMAKNAKNTKKTKIPNFDTFRKKLILIAGGGAALIALLVWMFVFAPGATVVITASTTPAPVSSTITLGGTAATNFEEGIVSSASQQIQREEAVEFEATGEKDVGEKATGTMRLARTSVSNQPLTVPAGTQFTSSGVVFISSQAATLAGTSVGPGGIVQDSATVTVEAAESGTNSNVSARAYSSSVSGFSAQGSAMAGGTSKVAKVVSADDVERAQGQLVGAATDAPKDELKKRFTNGELVIDSSFTVDRGAIVSTPAVGAEASSGKAKLAVPTTYSIQAVSKNDLDTYLRKSLESNLDNADSEKVYSTGVDEATIGNFRKEGETLLASVSANGSVGPVINEDSIKEQVKGKRYGEVQQSLESINGIKSVDVQFSYFWVRTVPNNTDKISIQFKVQDE